MNTLILVSKLPIIHFLNITTFHFLKNGFPFSYMTVLNVNVINTSIKKLKLLLHNHFQNMLHPLIIEFLWTLKDLLIPLHITNLTYTSSLTLSVTLSLQYLLNNIIFQYTNPLPFETEPHTIHTIPVAREHSDSYLYYIRYKTLETTPSQQPFQIIFNPIQGINNGIYYRTIHPQNIALSIQDVFIIYMRRRIEFNGNLDPPLYLPSHLEDLKHKSEYFEVSDIETRIQRHDKPHYWLQQDVLQAKTFHYRFFHNITLSNDTIPQVKIFTQFLLKFFSFQISITLGTTRSTSLYQLSSSTNTK